MIKVVEPLFYYKKKVGNGQHQWFPVSVIKQEVIDQLVSGDVGKKQSPLFWYFLKYQDEGVDKYYPVQLLYRSPIERYFNSILVGERELTDEEYSKFTTSIEDMCGTNVNWYFKHFIADMDELEQEIYLDKLIRDTESEFIISEDRVKNKLRLLSAYLTLREEGNISYNLYSKYNDLALELAVDLFNEIGLDGDNPPTHDDIA